MNKESYFKVFVGRKSQYVDTQAVHLKKSIHDYLNLDVEGIKIHKIYGIKKPLTVDQLNKIANGPLLDPIVEETSLKEEIDPKYDWTIEVSYKPGMTDSSGNTAQLAIEDLLGVPFIGNEEVYSATKYQVKGALTLDDVQKIADELIANQLIEEIKIEKNGAISRQNSHFPAEIIDVDLPDEALFELSQVKELALSLEEMQAIKEYYSQSAVAEKRNAFDLPKKPTDVELEVLAQTWSEHCKHKIFNARITYQEDGKSEVIDSIFKTYIKKATDELSAKKEWLVSVFTDNAGIIAFNEKQNICFKVETHNSPSALDPYGGALTGILGVNRDILGAGIGARIVANSDVFCFAPPNYSYPIPKKLHHPKRIFEGVRKGVEHGGNKSGVPTVNGAIVFDDRYLGKPLVYCGTVGIMPKIVQGTPSHEKNILPGDRVVIAGGRTGRDGIHGATFSSEELSEKSTTSAVQIGDPFTQKKLHDFLLEARDLGLYRTLTDNGAGGFSSSVGELAEITGGCEVHLENALLKSFDLKPWEIFLSESQERMTLAVDKSCFKKLEELARKHEVELCDIGHFTESGFLHVYHKQHTVAYLSMEFLHHGLPQLDLEASWKTPEYQEVLCRNEENYGETLKALLSCYNICSKESVIRQYDHEVGAGVILKPLTGVANDGPSDAAIVRPIESMESEGLEGIVMSNGICPKFSSLDTYWMAASAIDEAIRNYVAVGGDPDHLAILDNFCWPDPVYHAKKNSDGKFKLAQLVRANKALYEVAKAFEVPIISGKDSMKNDFRIGETKISVPPTLLVSAFGKIENIEKSVTMDFKVSGDSIYVIGITRKEMGGSEYAEHFHEVGGSVPTLDAKEAIQTYRRLHQTMLNGLVTSCHDCSDGGIAVAVAESAFSGDLGATVCLDGLAISEPLNSAEILFSESNSRFIVSVAKENCRDFESMMIGSTLKHIGEVTSDPYLLIRHLNQVVIHEGLNELKRVWQEPLKGNRCL